MSLQGLCASPPALITVQEQLDDICDDERSLPLESSTAHVLLLSKRDTLVS